ncbi:MAG TPA: LysR family transcriptional regulator [Acidimicrobiales bacterium]|nr:LysR family transcriptional regulator [Acidimicrobiales bacterium]
MELRQVEVFVVLARHRSFTRAAEALGVAQPALSQQVKRLEQELGVRLLDRSTRPVRLTDAGAAFLARAERILTDAALAREEMRELAGAGRRRVVVGALPALAARWLPPLLGTFHADHPRVEIAVRQGNTDEMARLVSAGQLDLALLHAVPGRSGHDGLPAGVFVERLFDEELVVVAPPDHALAGERAVTLSRLRSEAFVLVGRGSGLTHTIVSGTAGLGFRPSVAAEAPDVTVVRNLVAAGLGVSVIPRLPAEAPGPAVAVLRLTPPLPPHVTVVAWRGDPGPSTAADALRSAIQAHAVAVGDASARPGGRRRRR